MLEALQFEFMRNALMAGLLASIICGIMGTLVVANRIVFLSGGIAHAAYGGIGMAFYFGWPYLAATIGFALAAALVSGLGYLGFTAGQVLAGAKLASATIFTEPALGLDPLQFSLLMIAVVTIAYTVLGGLKAVKA